ncbi:MAG: guanosine monophosphate reductase [Pseudomonadota bacterium]
MIVEAITYDDVMLVPAYNHYESRRVVDISMEDKRKRFKLELPVFSANMDTITESAMANYMASKGGMGVLHRFMTIEKNVEEFKKCTSRTFVSVGCSEKEFERAEALKDAGAEYFCVDVAHAHGKYVGKAFKKLRDLLPNACLMGGNVATYAGADYLASCGADLIKVGIGGGSVCTTRIKTGFGLPMLTSIQQCAKTARSIVADGGIRTPGDIVKALAFGADFVMVGGMLAGTRPTPGEIVDRNERKAKLFRGMASREAQDEFSGGMTDWKTSEGIALEVPYRDDVDSVFADIIGGLRSGLTYGGANTILELQRKLEYVLVSPAGRLESLPHKIFA